MNSREEILGRVRAGLQRNATNAAVGREVMAAALSANSEGPKPVFDATPQALLERFRVKSELQSSTVDIVAADADVPAAIARYLTDMKLPKTAVVQPALAALDWAAAGLAVEARGARDADLVGITGCFCAVAETGTLMMCSSPSACCRKPTSRWCRPRASWPTWKKPGTWRARNSAPCRAP
jgi:L-lactate dehydrogenase complex protein LldG